MITNWLAPSSNDLGCNMISVYDLWNHLKHRGFTFFSGVPCSILKEIIRAGTNDPDIRYIPAVKENAALGTASGAYLAGTNSGIFIQNSGLGNIINSLTSFNLIYKIPVLMFITWRGHQRKDSPEHIIMGEKTLPLLKELNIPTFILSEDFKKDIDRAIHEMRNRSIPVAVVLKKGIVR
jgi:sulfopyruvate decarboxylase alpha subunit